MVCVSACVHYLNLLPAQHCQFPHVPERLQQVVVELSRRLQQLSVRLVLLGVHLQQLHHAVRGFVLLQHLGQKNNNKHVVMKRWSSGSRDPTHTPLTVYVKGQGWRCVRIFLVSKSHIEGPNQRCVSMRLNTFRLLYSNCGFWFILKTHVCVLKNKDLHVDPLFYLKRRHRSFKQQRTVFKYFL